MAAWIKRPPLWATLLACAVVLVARKPDVVSNPQFWAEDGPVFFQHARTLGAQALLEPSAGYLHTVLRLVAGAATWFDPMLAPALYVAAAFLLTLYVAARTQSRRCPLPASPGYALAVVLVPDAFEVLLNLTNLQWVLAGGLLLLLISRDPRTLSQRVHDGMAAVTLGLTGPFVVPLFPLFVWRARRRRTAFSALLALLAFAAAVVQGWIIWRSSGGADPEPIAAGLLLAVPGIRLGGSLLAGGHFGPALGVGWWSIAGALALAGAATLALRRGTARTERIWLGLALAGLLAISLFRCRHALPVLLQGGGSRYFFPLQLIALWLLVAATASAIRWARSSAHALLALSLVLNVARLREPAMTDCQWADYAAQIRKGVRTTVRINPDWEFTLPGTPAANALPVGVVPRATLVNVSTRCLVRPGQPAIAGFVLHAGPPRQILIRAIGPSLAQFGIEHAVREPTLQLLQDGREVSEFAAVRRPGSDRAVVQAGTSCLAFPLAPNSDDVAGVALLPPGTYTAVVAGGHDETGEVLIEIYEVPGEVSSG